MFNPENLGKMRENDLVDSYDLFGDVCFKHQLGVYCLCARYFFLTWLAGPWNEQNEGSWIPKTKTCLFPTKLAGHHTAKHQPDGVFDAHFVA